MTVSELCELLANYPQDLPVMVDGYEGGFDDVAANQVAIQDIQLDVNKFWFYGRHDTPEEPRPPTKWDMGEPPNRYGPTISALVISRERNRDDRVLNPRYTAAPAGIDNPPAAG